MRYQQVIRLLVVGCWLLVAASSCNKKDDTVIDYQYDYVPLDSGHYVVYDVDSIRYLYTSPNTTVDSIHYQLRELVADTFYTAQGELNYRIELYRRASENDSWSIDRVWYAQRTKNNFQKVEEDVRYVKLIFPPTEDAVWNGNIYAPNTGVYEYLNGWEYGYNNVGAAQNVAGVNFDSTLTVEQVNEENLIDKILSREMYARRVGMIYKEWEMLHNYNPQQGWASPQEGFRVRMYAREWN